MFININDSCRHCYLSYWGTPFPPRTPRAILEPYSHGIQGPCPDLHPTLQERAPVAATRPTPNLLSRLCWHSALSPSHLQHDLLLPGHVSQTLKLQRPRESQL